MAYRATRNELHGKSSQLLHWSVVWCTAIGISASLQQKKSTCHILRYSKSATHYQVKMAHHVTHNDQKSNRLLHRSVVWCIAKVLCVRLWQKWSMHHILLHSKPDTHHQVKIMNHATRDSFDWKSNRLLHWSVIWCIITGTVYLRHYDKNDHHIMPYSMI